MNPRRIKTISASLAFLPLLPVGLEAVGLFQSRGVEIATTIFYFPVLLLMKSSQTFHLSKGIMALSTLILMILWSSLIAAVFYKIASACLSEDMPGGKFDWIGFQVRFFCGAVLGALIGWRVWINLYRGHGPGPKNAGSSLLICAAIGATVIGLIAGLGYREDFWRRPP